MKEEQRIRRTVVMTREAVARFKIIGGTVDRGIDLASYATSVDALLKARNAVLDPPAPKDAAEKRPVGRPDFAGQDRLTKIEAGKWTDSSKAEAMDLHLGRFVKHGYTEKDFLDNERHDECNKEIQGGYSPAQLAGTMPSHLTPDELEHRRLLDRLSKEWDAMDAKPEVVHVPEDTSASRNAPLDIPDDEQDVYFCAECGEQQFDSPAGMTCPNGHVGAPCL